MTSSIVPTLKHRRCAQRLLLDARVHGTERIYDVATTWSQRDAALVIVALACLVDQPAPPDPLEPHRPRLDDAVFTESDHVRAMHAAYTRGERTTDVVEGERKYQRDRGRRRRAEARRRRESEAAHG